VPGEKNSTNKANKVSGRKNRHLALKFCQEMEENKITNHKPKLKSPF
jgi:hypothetical protein